MVRSYRLQPSAQGKRLQFNNNALKVIDGPFAESKELIGGFSVMELTGIDEAVALLHESEATRLMTPKRLGGYEMSPRALVQGFEKLPEVALPECTRRAGRRCRASRPR